jgi:hypothetical protein
VARSGSDLGAIADELRKAGGCRAVVP